MFVSVILSDPYHKVKPNNDNSALPLHAWKEAL